MSKKNSLATKRRRHEFDKMREKDAAEKKQKADLKKADKKIEKPVQRKTKAVRIRKGMKLRGIKVKDADSKRKVRKILAQEQAMKMAIDNEPQGSRVKSKTGAKVKKMMMKKEKGRKEEGVGDGQSMQVD